MTIHTDCIFYKGDIPCLPHKRSGFHCSNCTEYKKISHRILIIKLGAAGDVIRTTPLIRKLKDVYPEAHVTWLTDFPDLVPPVVDSILSFHVKNITWIQHQVFDIIYSLDKDKEAIAIAEVVSAGIKYGFGMDRFGHARPFSNSAISKLHTGIFDDVSQKNTKSYPQEIFEICGFEFEKQEYILNNTSQRRWQFSTTTPIVGLNTGCGGRWTSRLWNDEAWVQLATLLQKQGMSVIWLGGEQEHKKNSLYCERAGGIYPGFFQFDDFIALVNHVDIVVTQVTMAMHIAIGLKKKLVLMNNIFNKHEFELYNRGEIIEPPEPCGCYYTPVCPHHSMDQITPVMVFEAILRQQG